MSQVSQKQNIPSKEISKDEKMTLAESKAYNLDIKHKKEDKDLIKNTKKKIPEPAHGSFKEKVTQGLSNDETSISGPDVESLHFPN